MDNDRQVKVVPLALGAVMALALAGCWKDDSYRYKLTLAVNTPDGVKRAATVGEVTFRNAWIPERGTMHRLRGEALYLDLGPGKRPLIALLTKSLHEKHGQDVRWTLDAGPDTRFIARLYGETPSVDFRDDLPRIARMRGPRKIGPGDLPDIVTFGDANNPASVLEVEPDNLQATLGPNITWNEITLESTDEPISKGIELRLPWIASYSDKMLDGDHYRDYSKNTLANKLSTIGFHENW